MSKTTQEIAVMIITDLDKEINALKALPNIENLEYFVDHTESKRLHLIRGAEAARNYIYERFVSGDTENKPLR